jgi:hypothetical protein
MSLGLTHMNENASLAIAGDDVGNLLPARQQTAPYLVDGVAIHAYEGPVPVAYDEHLSEIQFPGQINIPAIGLLGAQLSIQGELIGDEIGMSQTIFPRQPANILFIRRSQILEARIALAEQFSHGLMLADRIDPIGALLSEMYKKPLGHQGHAYVAVVALSEMLHRDGRSGLQVSYAAGQTAVRKLFLDLST